MVGARVSIVAGQWAYLSFNRVFSRTVQLWSLFLGGSLTGPSAEPYATAVGIGLLEVAHADSGFQFGSIGTGMRSERASQSILTTGRSAASS